MRRKEARRERKEIQTKRFGGCKKEKKKVKKKCKSVNEEERKHQH